MLKISSTLAATCLFLFSGCGQLDLMNFRSQNPEENDNKSLVEETKTKVETPLIGEYVNVDNLGSLVLEGVGLVTGLPGTGGDPPVSPYRAQLIEEMRRRDITNPNQILRSKSTALVIVRAYLPPLVEKGERFDVQVRVPENSEVTSLNGGFLLETYLTEKGFIQGEGVMDGHVWAKAGGPIMTGTSTYDEDTAQDMGTMVRGRILSGGMSVRDRDMSLMLRKAYQSERMAYRVANRVGTRFFDYEIGGQRVPLAEAKNNKRIELKIHSRYKDNYPRYLSVIRNMSLNESEVAERVRMQRLTDELQDPSTAEKASIQLEAIGQPAIEVLKTGLKSDSLEVQFYSALALAYLQDPTGIEVLAKTAKEEPAFRIFSLAALAVVDDSDSFMALRGLLDGDSAETRYGAFRALKSLDPHDPFVRGTRMPGGFRLHILDVEGDPMVHMTRFKQAEVVVFGTGQKFTLPLIARAGKDVMITGRAGENKITVSKITLNETERRIVPNDVPSVINAISELGASYPDIAQFLIQSRNQSNLISRLEFDAMPRAGRVYLRPDAGMRSSTRKKSRIGRPTMAPNIFSNPQGDSNEEDEYDVEELTEEEPTLAEVKEPQEATQPDEEIGEASSADVTSPVEETPTATLPVESEERSTEVEVESKRSFFKRGDRESLYPSPFSLFKRSTK
ncbi:MAG: flagellar basal body P-ring protein FlgI [Planctomycetaceae bacterium]|nr:flagellar basal body P-ring protein FlgI [Planctomycetaceae bacterium]